MQQENFDYIFRFKTNFCFVLFQFNFKAFPAF